MSAFYQSPNGGVVFEGLNLMYVDINPLILFYIDYSVFDVPQSSLRENVELGNAKVFGFQHTKLHHGKSFGWQKSGAVMVDMHFWDEYATYVNAEVVGEVVDSMGVFEQCGIEALVILFWGVCVVVDNVVVGCLGVGFSAEFSISDAMADAGLGVDIVSVRGK